MPVITISRQYGSYGDEIAQKLCETLDYQYFDKLLIRQAASEAGLTEQEIMDYTDENYKVRTFLARMLSRPPTPAQMVERRQVTQGPEKIAITEENMLELVQKAIRHAHQIGNVVIVGRGGQVVLQNEPDVLHVRVEAPIEARIMHVKEWHPFETKVDIRREAQDLILEKDQISADYLKHFYHVRWDDPALYHIILNTEKLDVDQAVSLLAHLVREILPKPENMAAAY